MKKICLICMLFLLVGCQLSKPQPALPLLKIGVAPVNQPSSNLELMAGYFPEYKTVASPEELAEIGKVLEEKLSVTQRQYTFLPEYSMEELLPGIATNSTKGILAYWVAYGQLSGNELLLVPQVYYYENEENNVNPMGLMLDFYLIDLRNEGMLLKRSHFAEQLEHEAGVMSSFVVESKKIKIENMIEDAVNTMIQEFSF